MINKIVTLVSLVMCLLAFNANAAYDGTIRVYQGSGFSYGNGGEFQAVTSGIGTFQTFCIEENENFSPGSAYNYRINTGAVKGGAGANATDPFTGNSMDNISIGTAWLYDQFSDGTLSGYNYTYGSGRSATAGALQNAIWWLENEGGANNAFVTLAETMLGLNDTTVRNDSQGAYGVKALNLYDGNGNVVQDQLAIVVPEPTTLIAGALLLLPFGISTLRIVRRK
jgi:hypothetical protein